jgi:peptide/nickel transport system permease protein
VTLFPKLRATVRKPSGAIGAVILVAIFLIAFAGPFLAPYSPTETLGLPGAKPGGGFLLGTDYLGRDLFSRLLNGGASVLLMASAATLAAYLLGVLIGVVAGSVGGWIEMALMRLVDIVLAFPPLMVLLLLVGGMGSQVWVLVLGVTCVQVPGIARVTRAAAQSVNRSEFVEASRVRGDSAFAIWRMDIFANISSLVLADFGVRFGAAIILIASINYLGLGLVPPVSDWGLMISENQNFLSMNAYAVIVPAAMLALITVGVNLFADAYVQVVQAGSGT